MNNLLVPLLNAGDERERQRCVDELLTIHVAPIIRQVLRRQLGFYVSAQGVSETNRDAEDLYQEALARMVEVLHGDQRVLTTIDNFERYVGRIVSNICIDFLRSKHPARTRLKNALRDVFTRNSDLVSWQDQNETLCGFAAWRNTGKEAVSALDVETTLNGFLTARFADEDVRGVPLSRIVTEVLHWLSGPVQFDVLVRMLAYIRDIKDEQPESLDDDFAAELEIDSRRSTRSAQSDIETHELLRRLWPALKRLTPRQRDAFALSFQDHAGRNLFTVLLAARIVEWKDLEEVMGRPVEDLTRLWTQMPMDSAAVASELHTSRDNVYKLVYRARQKLKADL